MDYLFNVNLKDHDTWWEVVHSNEAFRSLIEHIFKKHDLYMANEVVNKSKSNANFIIGEYVLKIFAPDNINDYMTERFGLNRAFELGVPCPKLLAYGVVCDRYDFNYLIMEYIDAKEFGKVKARFSHDDKVMIGSKMRQIMDKLNTPCERFNDIYIFEHALSDSHWQDLPEKFVVDRAEYIKHMDKEGMVYCHGDIIPDNVLIDRDNNIYLIDFADAVLAPKYYEISRVVCSLFDFDSAMLEGYLGEYNETELAKRCTDGIAINLNGVAVIEELGIDGVVQSIKMLEEELYERLGSKRSIMK